MGDHIWRKRMATLALAMKHFAMENKEQNWVIFVEEVSFAP